LDTYKKLIVQQKTAQRLSFNFLTKFLLITDKITPVFLRGQVSQFNCQLEEKPQTWSLEADKEKLISAATEYVNTFTSEVDEEKIKKV